MDDNMRRVKVAWIRNPNAPMGQAAKGRLNCPCGNAPESDYSEDSGDVACACGVRYTWNGYVVDGPSLSPTATMVQGNETARARLDGTEEAT